MMEKISTADCKQRFAIGALIFRPESAVLFFRFEKRATAAGFLGPRSDGEALADLLERKNTDGPTCNQVTSLYTHSAKLGMLRRHSFAVRAA